MSRVVVSRAIDAPADRVFSVLTDIERLPDSNPDVVAVEFVGDTRRGPGTRFRETRRSGKKEMVTELELVEWDEGRSARFVSDAGGTVWDTTFRVEPRAPDACHLTIDMDARPHTWLARIMLPLIRGMIRRGMTKHLDGLASYCARAAR